MRYWFTAVIMVAFTGSASAASFNIDPSKYPSSGIVAFFSKEFVAQNAAESEKSMQGLNEMLAGIGLQPLKREPLDSCYMSFTVTDALGVSNLYTLYSQPSSTLGMDEDFPTYRLLQKSQCGYDAKTFTESCKTESGGAYLLYHPNGDMTKSVAASSKADLDQILANGNNDRTATIQSCETVKDDLIQRISTEKPSDPPNPKLLGAMSAVAREFIHDPAFKAAFLKAAQTK